MTSRVVITGAARGLGRALAMHYLEQGDEVWAGVPGTGPGSGIGWARRARVPPGLGPPHSGMFLHSESTPHTW